MRIPSGVTDQGFYFVAVDATDYVTRETGLATWTVVRSRNGAADATMTTPTITEIDNSTMPGVYFLLCDEDMTITSGDQSQAMTYHITHAGMAPVTREIELYRPSVTAGETLTVSSGTGNAAVQSIANNAITTASINDGAFTAAKFASDFLTAAKVAADVGTEIATAVWASATRLLTAGTNIVLAKGTGITGFNDLSAAQVNAEADTALADYDGPTNAEMVARTLAAAEYATATNLQTVDNNVDAILVDTGTDIPATLAALNNISTSDVEAIVWDVPMASHLGAGTTGDAIFQAAIAAMAVQAVTDNLPDNGALTSIAQASDLATAQTDLDTLTGADGATLATLQPNYAPAVAGDVPSASDNATELLDQAAGVETGMTVRAAFRLFASALLGKASGMNTTTAVFRDTGDSKDRITATVDQYGNRSSVTLDAS